jgi:arylsulfatase
MSLLNLSSVAAPLAGSNPNIIIILTDDQGYGDLACHGHPYLRTPNIDKLYHQSTRFTDYQVSPTCAPSRSALMTGKLPFKNGVTHTILERERLSLQSVTIAQQLKKANYTTAIFGKWHLGDEAPYQPGKRGFDEVFIHGAGGIGQSYPGSCADVPGNIYFDPVIRHNGCFVKTSGFCTDIFFRQALGWIKTNKNNHFFAYIAVNAPHGPFRNVPQKPLQYYLKHSKNKRTAAFYAMIENIDDNVGLLMQKLDEWKLADDTIVIFMTDNGSSKGDYNSGMKGKKGSVHEGGTRVPLFMRWPGHIIADRDINTLTRHVDIFPTLSALAGVALPKDIDGYSLLPLLGNPDYKPSPRYTCFHAGRWAKPGINKWGNGGKNADDAKYKNFAVRSENWRLVGPKELYDLSKDHCEKNNVINKHPEVARKMLDYYEKWWSSVRPLMINENVPLAEKQPFPAAYKMQKETTGIPVWIPPDID